MTKSGRRPLVAGNWKMNGLRASIAVVEAVRNGLTPELAESTDILICPPSTLIASCVAAAYGSLAARRAGLCGIICVGETKEEREEGRTLDIVRAQLAIGVPKGATARDTVIAYEPVWAIGTGLTPTPGDIAEVHASLREMLGQLIGAEAQAVRILYGGSVKPSNARELMAVENVDGALVGGASLVAEDFLGIARAYLR